MKTNNERPASRRNDPRARGCCSLFLGILLICICAGIVIYMNNNRPPDIVIPTPTMPAVNAYNDFVLAGQMARGMQHKTPYDAASPQQLQQERSAAYLAAFHKDAAPVLAVLRRGLNKPYLNPPLRSFSDEARYLPNYARFREIARIMAGEAEYYKRNGQPAKAANALLDGLEMGVMLPHGGGLIPGLVGWACDSICIRDFEPLLPRLSPAELAQVAARLDRIEAKRASFADVLMEEANEEIAKDMEALHNAAGMKLLSLSRSLTEVSEEHPPKLRQWKQMVLFSMANKTAMLRQNRGYLLALASESRKPYIGKSHIPIPDNLLAQWYDSLPSAWRKFLSDETVAALLRTEVAMYRYHEAYSRYPDVLAQLVPDYLNSIPYDPFGGGANIPLRYRVTAGGKSFLLYSLGPDLHDDGGKPTRFPGDQPGDIVAGQLWPQKANSGRKQ